MIGQVMQGALAGLGKLRARLDTGCLELQRNAFALIDWTTVLTTEIYFRALYGPGKFFRRPRVSFHAAAATTLIYTKAAFLTRIDSESRVNAAFSQEKPRIRCLGAG